MDKYFMMIIYIVLVIAFLFLTKKIADVITKFDDDAQISQNSNLAIALRRFGIFVGFSIAMTALLADISSCMDAIFFIIHSLIVVMIFFAAHLINDYIIIHGVSNNDLVKEGNIPTGLIEAGAFIATGLLVNGAFSGDEGGIISAIAFFFLGQAVMIIAIHLHEKLYKFNIVLCVQENNLAAGVTVAGLLISYSIILRASIAGNFMGWGSSLLAFFISAFVGMACLIVFERIASLIFLPKTSIREDIQSGNTAALVLVQSITIALSLVISQFL